jgi:hypothetical protein
VGFENLQQTSKANFICHSCLVCKVLHHFTLKTDSDFADLYDYNHDTGVKVKLEGENLKTNAVGHSLKHFCKTVIFLLGLR